MPSPSGNLGDPRDDEPFDYESVDDDPFDPATIPAAERDDEPFDEAQFDEYNAPPGELPLGMTEDDHAAGPKAGEGEAFAHHARRPGGIGFAEGGPLDVLEPGPALAGFLADAFAARPPSAADVAARPATARGLSGLTDDELVGVLRGARRMASLAAAQEIEAVIELAGRRAAQSSRGNGSDPIEHLSDEVAAALTLTPRAAADIVGLSGELARLPAVLTAMNAGVIDRDRGRVFAEELASLDDARAHAIAAEVLPIAGGLTTGQLRYRLRLLVKAADPDALRRRREAARKDDAAVHLWEELSGNWALAGRELTPAEAAAIWARLTAQAEWLQAHGAEGSFDALRLAAFTAGLSGRALSSLIPDAENAGPPPGEPPAASGWPAVTGSINLTLPLAAYLGRSDAPGEIAGPGVADADTCRQLAAWLAEHRDTRWCLTLTDRDGHAVAHACARHGPGPPDPALVIRWAAGLRPTRLEAGECGHARQVPGYRPPASLRHLITTRQRTCSAPGCRRPARGCDLDHTVPWDQGGRTCECNCAPLCRRHHRAKQAPGWHLAQPEPGTMIWTLPSGRTYRTGPDPYPI